MTPDALPYASRLARSRDEVEAAQALRFAVFVEELGAEVGAACQKARREWDRFDGACEHLIVVNGAGAVVGATRLMDEDGAERAGGFATEEEFDLGTLRRSGRRLMEVGRTCIHPAHRGGLVLPLLWQAVARIVAGRSIGLAFGLASLPGTDPDPLAGALSLLMGEHLAPEATRPVSRQSIVLPPEPFDRQAAALALPPLVRAYLRLGAKVGEGAFVDRRFGCTDVCVVLDASTLTRRAEALLRAAAA